MLPPGHIAAGYLTAKVLLHFTHASLPAFEQSSLLWWGVFFGAAPDLDLFYAFWKVRSFRVLGGRDISHRKFFSHAPIPWLIASALIYFLASSLYVQYIGLLLWLASWSHFLFDSFDYGIMWLWPFTSRVFSLKNRELSYDAPQITPVAYYWQLIKFYTKTLTFYLEILVIISALAVYFRQLDKL